VSASVSESLPDRLDIFPENENSFSEANITK
jgi:hypothetical protein